MSHFAKLNESNVVIFVAVGRQEDDDKEAELCARTGEVYRQTSYNTSGGILYDNATGEPSADQSKALRKNFAGIGYTYDSTRDAFIPPQPYASWLLDDDTCLWQAPVPYPEDGELYTWDEDQQQWVLQTPETEE